MKYNSSNKPLVCMQTQSTCYKNTSKKMTIRGVLWHCTGANNPTLKRYVQPSDIKPSEDTYTKAEWLEILGTNSYNNDWNHIERWAGLNCWIGKLADGTITTVQTMPWEYKPWGCGKGPKGSCNDGWIQFEICEDGLIDKEYFNKAYREACEITAYLCKLYEIDPNGTVLYNGVKVPTILCHQDSYRLGLGGDHSDIYNWFSKHGKNMESVRQDVAIILRGADPVVIGSTSVVSTSATEATINFSTNEYFNKYSWTYNLTALKTSKTVSNVKFLMKSTKTSLKLNNLIPNNVYSLEIVAIDEFKNIIKSPNIIFSTQQDYPAAPKNVQFNINTEKVSFEKPSSWGSYSGRTKGYRVSIFLNGQEKVYSDTLIKYNNTADSTITKDISSLFSKVTLHYGDTLQVSIKSWVKDEQNKLIFAETLGSCSKPIYLKPLLDPVYKLFLNVENDYKQAVLYSIK